VRLADKTDEAPEARVSRLGGFILYIAAGYES
jgi:hypothetical protein